MEKESMGERLEQYLTQKGVSQSDLARRAGIKQQTVNYLIKSKSQGSSYAVRIASALGINPAWLQEGVGSPLDPMIAIGSGDGLSSTRAHWVPKVQAAEVKVFLESGDSAGPRVVTAFDVSPGSFAMDVVGRSMSPDLKDGDEVVIDVQLKPEPGDFVIALEGDVLLLRRYRELAANVFELVPSNADFPVVRSSEADIRLVGVVVEHRRRLRR